MKGLLQSRRFYFLSLPGILILVTAFGLVEPGNPVGTGVFHAGYALPPTRPAFLKFYQLCLKEHNGGYLPDKVDAFLVGRLSTDVGNAEKNAIVDFQINQGPGRWSRAALESSTEVQQDIVSNIVPRLERMKPEMAKSAILLIESFRRGEDLRKSRLIGIWKDSTHPTDELMEDALVDATNRIQVWWSSGEPWDSLRKHSPLEGSSVEIFEFP